MKRPIPPTTATPTRRRSSGLFALIAAFLPVVLIFLLPLPVTASSENVVDTTQSQTDCSNNQLEDHMGVEEIQRSAVAASLSSMTYSMSKRQNDDTDTSLSLPGSTVRASDGILYESADGKSLLGTFHARQACPIYIVCLLWNWHHILNASIHPSHV